MTDFKANDPDFEERVRNSFARQGFMKFMGAEITTLEPGFCELRLPFKKELSQQHGYFHGGVIGSLADDSAGYASFTLMGKQDSILTVEYKLNLLAPGAGEMLIARGWVIKPGRRLTVSRSEVFALKGGNEKLCATALATMIKLENHPDH